MRWNLHGTKIVRNGDPGADDVRWGLMLRVAAWGLGVGSVCLSAFLIGFVSRAVDAFEKVNVICERQQGILHRVEYIEGHMIAWGDVVKRDEWLAVKESQQRDLDSINSKLSVVVDGQTYNRMILSKLPVQKEARR